MNKIELLPKDIYYNDELYQIGLWVTAFGKLCIGYRKALNSKYESLFSVCVEPENEPFSVLNAADNYINKNVGNMPTLDDACDDLMNYIKVNNIKTREQSRK